MPQSQRKQVFSWYELSIFLIDDISQITLLKEQWNTFRDHCNAKSVDEKHDILNVILNEMKSRILQVTLRHDASRIVQCLLQFGNEDQRGAILNELLKKSADISKTPYGHFTILKAISYCTKKEEQEAILKSLSGHFLSLGLLMIPF
jgi:pumilio family protein 6